jgi:O-methyltransferase
MLLRVLKSIFSGSDGRATPPPRVELPHEASVRIGAVHARAPMGRHLDIALGGMRIGEHELRALSDRCLAETEATAPPLKALRRPLAAYFLARYFLYAMDLGGAYAECGVFRGTTALFLCRAARTRLPGYAGEDLHLIDSFEGLSRPSDEDYIDDHAADGSVVRAAVPQGSLSAPAEFARRALRDFPAASIHPGWIPAVFEGLPEKRWAFLHIDVDLHEPTLECLEYFYPRLVAGGVILCDDYGSQLFPGARRAWDSFCEDNDVPFVVLDTGQSVLLKP